MRTEIKDVDPRDAAAFAEDLIGIFKITSEEQANALTKVLRRHEMRAEIWIDSSGRCNSAPLD